MKKLFSMLTMVAAVMCIGIIPAQATKIANFNVSDSYITVGESFDIEVSVYDDGALGDLTIFGFDVDSSALSLFSYGNATLATDFDDAGIGGDYIGGLYNGMDNAGTDVLLATLSFTAGATAGTDTLSIEGLFDDFSGLYYECGNEDIRGNIRIAIDPIPEPSTILLIGAGLLGLLGYSRKRLNKKA